MQTRVILRRHFSGRLDPFTSAVLVFPLFLTYQIGILAGAKGRNGADYITEALIRLCSRDLATYLQVLAGMVVVYALGLAWLRRRGRFHPRAFLPMLAESALYGFFMGGVIQVVIVRADRVLPLLALGGPDLTDVVVISAGAGFFEELVFRAVGMGGLMRLTALPMIPLGRLAGMLVALVVSSVVFSLVHHVGPGGEPFTNLAFVYRALAGMIFGLIWYFRGFAVAAWTHALYDVFVLLLG
jgi:membrane protease YdiL (CAAX protease family)